MRGLLFAGTLALACGSADPVTGFSAGSENDAGGGGMATGGVAFSSGGSVHGGSGGAPASGGRAQTGGAAGKPTSCVNTECTGGDCCEGTTCVPGYGTFARCMPYCATDDECPSGWGCAENGGGCSDVTPAHACFPRAGMNMQHTCAPPCSSNADCGVSTCVTFFDGVPVIEGNPVTCPATPKNYCGGTSEAGMVKCPG